MPTRVLLCDTADEVARFQYHLLREHDLEVEVTTDAFRGVEAAVRSRPDVIVSELTLEGLGRRVSVLRPAMAGARSLEPEADVHQHPGFLWSSY